MDALFEQAIEQIECGHDAFTVSCALTYDRFDAFGDARSDAHYKSDLGAHVRSMIYRGLCDYGWTDPRDALETDDRAQTIGYDPAKFSDGAAAPNRTTLYRAWDEYFGDELQEVVEAVVQRIREYARDTGHLLGSQTLETEDKHDASPRTEYRFKRRITHEMADLFRDRFYDEIDIEMPENAQYDKEDLFDLYLHMAFSNDFATNGAKTWREDVDDEDTAPSGDTFPSYPRAFDELHDNEVSEMFDAVSNILWDMAERCGYLDGFIDVAIDGHAWRFYGDPDTPRVSSVKPDRGTNQAYEFLTLSVIGDEGEKFTLAIRQVASKQEKLEAVKDLIELANERLFIRDAVLDRGVQ